MRTNNNYFIFASDATPGEVVDVAFLMALLMLCALEDDHGVAVTECWKRRLCAAWN